MTWEDLLWVPLDCLAALFCARLISELIRAWRKR